MKSSSFFLFFMYLMYGIVHPSICTGVQCSAEILYRYMGSLIIEKKIFDGIWGAMCERGKNRLIFEWVWETLFWSKLMDHLF